MWALLPGTVTLCIYLDVGYTSQKLCCVCNQVWAVLPKTVTLCVILLWAVLPRAVTPCIHLDVCFIAQECYTVCTFRCGLYFATVYSIGYGHYYPELLHCAYI